MKNRAEMIEEAVLKRSGRLSDHGALMVDTGKYTGRATAERYIVRRPETEKEVFWSATNQPIDFDFARQLYSALEAKLSTLKPHTFRGNLGGHALEMISPSPWHIAFAENMFRDGEIPHFLRGLDQYGPIKILHDPFGKVSDLGLSFKSETLIVLDPIELKVAIIGTAYAGEIKKSAFSLCNYSLPDAEVLSMHASANCLSNGTSSCLLFGLSGTGKTTLSASPDRYLVGDDEILWTKGGLSNLESGCYAKLIDLTKEREPEIYRAVNQFGSIVENVALGSNDREIDFSSRARTENTRGSYPIDSYEKAFDQSREAEGPANIVFLIADAFGALPAVAKLNSWQAQYHFMSGYTSKVAGTEMGVKEPKSVFSACFGEPFMPRHPSVYAKLLAYYAERSGANIWLLNTGWTGGGYGVGTRFPLQVTRKILCEIQSGDLQHQAMIRHPVFGFLVPAACKGVDASCLQIPSGSIVDSLASQFRNNFERFSDHVDSEVKNLGGPK